MDQVVGLLLDGADDAGMGVAGRVDRDAGSEVEEQVAVDVLDGEAPPRTGTIGYPRGRLGEVYPRRT